MSPRATGRLSRNGIGIITHRSYQRIGLNTDGAYLIKLITNAVVTLLTLSAILGIAGSLPFRRPHTDRDHRCPLVR
jgi:hypothetical protein